MLLLSVYDSELLQKRMDALRRSGNTVTLQLIGRREAEAAVMNRKLLPKAYAALLIYLAALPLFVLPAAALFPDRFWQAVLLPVPALLLTGAAGLLPAKRRIPALLGSASAHGRGLRRAVFANQAAWDAPDSCRARR